MIEKLNAKIRPLLEIYEDLKDVLEIANIKIPKFATCGMQSHGKSSTLESITKIELPIKSGTCTICPIKICLRDLGKKEGKEGKPFYKIKLEDEEYDENDKYLTNFNKLREKIDEYQDRVRKEFKLTENKITEKKTIQIEVYKKDIPNLNLYDLPGYTHTKGIEEEAIRIYESFLEDEETIVLLILNGGDDLTNYSIINWMKTIRNYKSRFIPIVAKADTIKNFESLFNELNNLKLNNKPCLIINNNKELKNLSDIDEVKKIKEIIPKIEEYPINIGRKKLIDELIKIQYEKYKENFKDIINNVNSEILKNKTKLDKLPHDFDLKEKFCDSFIDTFEQLLKSFNEVIKSYKKGPEGTLLKYEIKMEYKKYIVKSKEKINEFLTLEFCNYVTENIIQTNSDKISILEDEIPFQLLITPKIKEILKIFEEIIQNIYKKIINRIEKDINNSFGQFVNLKNKVKELYEQYSKTQYDKMQKFYDEMCLLETRNISSFDLELDYKCNVLVRKILNFIYKKEIPKEKVEEKKEINTNSKIDENSSIMEPNNMENEINNLDDRNKDNEKNIVDISNNKIYDYRNEIIKGIKNINQFTIEKFKELTQETIDKLSEEVESNPNFKKEVKTKYEEYKSHISQIIGIINNYEIEQLTRIYDSLGCKGRPKLSYTPENITTFEERIEETDIHENDEYEFIPGFQFIKNQNLNDFIDLYKAGKVIPKTANTIIKMVSYAEVMCNRVIDIIFLSIQNYLYDYLTNIEMITNIRNKVHKLLFRINFEECKKLLEVNRETAEEIKKCKNIIKKLTSSLEDIEKAHKNFYRDDFQENEIDVKKNIRDENDNDNDDNKINNFDNEE